MARILITGASQGIGRASATELANRGHEVIATARKVEDLEGLDVARKLRLDVTSDADVQQVHDEVGRVDVLINNAGQLVRGSVEATPLAEFERLFSLNTVGALRVTQAFLPEMRQAGAGRLLFVSSIMGRLTLPSSSAYAATKWAMEGIAETLALETAHLGLSVGLLEPGAVATSGSSSRTPSYALEDDPYAAAEAARAGVATDAGTVISAEQVAREIADVVEAERIPLRIPIGAASRLGSEDRHAAPYDQAFVWVPRSR
jgi:short-subunit dehydrogenase